jgi:hypothetical protein
MKMRTFKVSRKDYGAERSFAWRSKASLDRDAGSATGPELSHNSFALDLCAFTIELTSPEIMSKRVSYG